MKSLASARDGLSGRTLLGLFALAFALRLLHILAMRGSLYFDHPIIDAEAYDVAARSIAAGRGHPDGVFWQPPGYPYFLALCHVLSEGSFLFPRLMQALLGASSVCLTAWLGARLFGRGVGLASGVAAAFHAMLIYYDGELLTPTLTITLQLAALAIGLSAGGSRWRWGLAGCLAGAAAAVTATSLLLAVALAVFARRRAGFVLLGVALALAPVTLRNLIKGDELVVISANGGINLYLGNNPRYDETVALRPDRQWKRLSDEPVRAGVRGDAAASRYFVGKVFAFARSEPGAFLALQARKLRLLAGGGEIGRNQAIYPARADSPVLRLLLWKIPILSFPFGALLPLAVVGLVVGARRAPLLAAWVALSAAGVVAFFVTSGYRMPLVPPLIIFGVEGVRWLATEASHRGRLIALGGGAAVWAIANLGQGGLADPWVGDGCLGTAPQKAAWNPFAVPCARMNTDAAYSLAVELSNEGRTDEALELYEQALALKPDYGEAWVNSGVLLAQRNRLADAERAFRRALALDSEDTSAMVNLATLRAAAGALDEAIALDEAALEREPSDEVTRGNLAILRARAAEAATSPGPPPARSPPAATTPLVEPLPPAAR
jgi:hypothetical protein